jgi:localization factor PodJL
MPSSDRFGPREDQPLHARQSRAEPASEADRTVPEHAEGQPQNFDPSGSWDAQSAEALTRLHESEEGRLWQQHNGDRAHRPRASNPQKDQYASFAAAGPAIQDGAQLEARLGEIALRLQESLADFGPDKAIGPLNQRLDLIEQRLGEALSGVAQRSDLDGLRLMEAHVLELAAHVERSRAHLDRLDALDDRMQELSCRFEEHGYQRLAALEKLLQDYIAEWRLSEQRTSTALGTLDDAVTRIGASLDAAEASKPATDLSLSIFDVPGRDPSQSDHDPISQVYADGMEVLGPSPPHAMLDAADYAPHRPPASSTAAYSPTDEAPVLPSASPDPDAAPAPHVHDPAAAGPAVAQLAPPAFRASEIRSRLRQLQMLDTETDATVEPVTPQAETPDPDRATGAGRRRTRPAVLLAAGIILFAAGGYLLVDAFIAKVQHGSIAPDAKFLRARSESDKAGTNKTTGGTRRADNDRAEDGAPKSAVGGRVGAIGGAIAAIFRAKSKTAPSPVPALYEPAPGPLDEASPTLVTALPMTIGPASLRQAAMNGEPRAQYEIAARYAAGHGVGQDLRAALQWYGRAAMRGLAPAQFRLAAMYERGLGTGVDAEKAQAWYTRAAGQGHVKAMHNLAVLSIGSGRLDYATAAKWFAEAAEHGLTDSQFNLAVLLQNGLGVPKDLKQAYKWFALAARGGDIEASSRVPPIKAQLSPAEVRAIDTTLTSWRARAPDPRANEVSAALFAGQ